MSERRRSAYYFSKPLGRVAAVVDACAVNEERAATAMTAPAMSRCIRATTRSTASAARGASVGEDGGPILPMRVTAEEPMILPPH